MSTNRTVSFKALRILTYTILIKAVVEVVVIVGMAFSADIMITVAKAAEFLNIVACVLCLAGVLALSEKFVYVYRIMVITLLLACLEMLLAAIGLYFVPNASQTAELMFYIVLTLMAAEKLLIGVAFLFLMKAFDELGGPVERGPVSGEKLSFAYLGASCFSAAALLEFGITGAHPALTALILIELVGVIMEILMYRSASHAAFSIWRNHTLNDADKRRIIR